MATSRPSRAAARPHHGGPPRTAGWLRLLGGACILAGVLTLLAGNIAVWTYLSLISCGLLLLVTPAMLTRRSDRKSSSLSAPASDPEKMSAADLSSMTPPAWDAIPPTVTMAAQPDAYFHNRRDRR